MALLDDPVIVSSIVAGVLSGVGVLFNAWNQRRMTREQHALAAQTEGAEWGQSAAKFREDLMGELTKVRTLYLEVQHQVAENRAELAVQKSLAEHCERRCTALQEQMVALGHKGPERPPSP
jgi:hypothetical protein